MRLYTLNGKTPIYKNVSKFLVDWDGSCRSKFQKSIKDFYGPNHLNSKHLARIINEQQYQRLKKLLTNLT